MIIEPHMEICFRKMQSNQKRQHFAPKITEVLVGI